MIFEKRGKWCYRDDNGKLQKFATEEEAKKAAGWVSPVQEPEIRSWLEDDDDDYEEEESED